MLMTFLKVQRAWAIASLAKEHFNAPCSLTILIMSELTSDKDTVTLEWDSAF